MDTRYIETARGNCRNCGKVIPIRDIRDKKARYCGRVCAGMGRYKTRYQGGSPEDRPDFKDKAKNL